MKKPDANTPPEWLSEKAKDWWRQIVAEWKFSNAELLVLQTAMECFDRMVGAQKIIEEDGPVILDRFGQQKQHPATLVERDARSSMLAALKQLKLELDPSNPAGKR